LIFTWGTEENLANLRINDVPAEIQTKRLQIRGQEWHRSSELALQSTGRLVD
jgi:hypothetical protein